MYAFSQPCEARSESDSLLFAFPRAAPNARVYVFFPSPTELIGFLRMLTSHLQKVLLATLSPTGSLAWISVCVCEWHSVGGTRRPILRGLWAGFLMEPAKCLVGPVPLMCIEPYPRFSQPLLTPVVWLTAAFWKG